MKKTLLVLPLVLLLTACGTTASSAADSTAEPSAASTAAESSEQSSEVSSEPVSVTYNINLDVFGEGGKKGITISLKDGSYIAGFGITDRKGNVTIDAPEGIYDVVANDLPDGYYQTEEVKTTAGNYTYTINANTKMIDGEAPSGTKYYKGDVVYDEVVNLSDGTTTSFKELMGEKKALVLNFWGIKCPYCVQEMPSVQSFYESYSEDVGFIAINGYSGDKTDAINEFLEENGYTFPSTIYETTITSHYRISGFPTTIVIDRYGRYAKSHVGYADSPEVFANMVDAVLDDNYTPSY